MEKFLKTHGWTVTDYYYNIKMNKQIVVDISVKPETVENGI